MDWDPAAALDAIDTNAVASFDRRMAQVQKEFSEMQRIQSELKTEGAKFQKSLGILQKELETASRNLVTAQAKRAKLSEQLKAADEEVKRIEDSKIDITDRIFKLTAEAEQARAGKISSISGEHVGVSAPASTGGANAQAQTRHSDSELLGDLFADVPNSQAASVQLSAPPPIGEDLLDMAGPSSQPATVACATQSPLDGLNFQTTGTTIGLQPRQGAQAYASSENLLQTPVPCGQISRGDLNGMCQGQHLDEQLQHWQQQPGQQLHQPQQQQQWQQQQAWQHWQQQQQWQQGQSLGGVLMSQVVQNEQVPLGHTSGCAGIRMPAQNIQMPLGQMSAGIGINTDIGGPRQWPMASFFPGAATAAAADATVDTACHR